MENSLWSAIKTRKLFKNVLVYLASSWVAIQVAKMVADIWMLPAPFNQVVFLLLILGFPVTLVLSWIFELSEEGLAVTGGTGFWPLLRQEYRRRPLTICFWSLVILLGSVGVITYGWPDERLSDDSRRLIATLEEPVVDDMNFNYAMYGFNAPVGTDIWEHGRFLVSAYSMTGVMPEEPEGLKFSKDVQAFCFLQTLPPLRDKACADQLLASVALIPGLLESNAILLQRYRDLHKAQGFHLPLVNPDDPAPAFSNLMTGAALEKLAILQLVANERLAEARRRLETEIGFHRRLLSQNPGLISKMISLRLLETDLLFANLVTGYLAASFTDMTLWNQELARLSLSERALLNSLALEGGWNIRLLNSPNSLWMDYWRETDSLEFAAFRLLPLRNNATINRLAQDFMQILQDSLLPADEYLGVRKATVAAPTLLDYFSNAAGLAFLNKDISNLYGYMQRGHDLDSLIVLVQTAQYLHSQYITAAQLASALPNLPEHLRDPYTGAMPLYRDGELYFDRAAIVDQLIEKTFMEPRLPYTPLP